MSNKKGRRAGEENERIIGCVEPYLRYGGGGGLNEGVSENVGVSEDI